MGEMPTLREIFRAGFGAYAKARNLPYRIYQAANAIMNCRSAALGGHVQVCEKGHVIGAHYNSCRHRSCPQCNERNRTQWADAQAARLLGCEHFHVIFTLPHELLQWWSYNRQIMADLLFSSSCGALRTLLEDERHLGASPGIVASLHTWGRTLSRHPHLHCLVSGGGLDANSEWRAVHGGYLLPLKVLKPVYRGKFLSGLESLVERGELELPESVSRESARGLLRTLARKEWNVRIQERYAYGEGVMRYLARYVRGGPISNRRLGQASEEAVEFHYRDHRDGKTKLMRLSREDFIGRVLWHVPECGRHTTRYYGLYGHKARARRAICRAQLGQTPEPEQAQAVDWQRYLERIGQAEKTRCPQCGSAIRMGAALPRNRATHPMSTGAVARSDFVQQDDQAANSGTELGRGPPNTSIYFLAPEWPLI